MGVPTPFSHFPMNTDTDNGDDMRKQNWSIVYVNISNLCSVTVCYFAQLYAQTVWLRNKMKFVMIDSTIQQFIKLLKLTLP